MSLYQLLLGHCEAMVRNMGATARMRHRMEAPEGWGRRMPEDLVSGFFGE